MIDKPSSQGISKSSIERQYELVCESFKEDWLREKYGSKADFDEVIKVFSGDNDFIGFLESKIKLENSGHYKFFLAFCLELGTKKFYHDLSRAAALYREAAEAEFPPAMYHYGCDLKSKLVSAKGENGKADFWFNKATLCGFPSIKKTTTSSLTITSSSVAKANPFTATSLSNKNNHNVNIDKLLQVVITTPIEVVNSNKFVGQIRDAGPKPLKNLA
jgi:TPR repeat protein